MLHAYAVAPKPADHRALLALIQDALAEMEGRIDPPSSIHRLTKADLHTHCAGGTLWAVGAPPKACMLLTARDDAIYISKLAVQPQSRGRGYARALIDAAEAYARARRLPDHPSHWADR